MRINWRKGSGEALGFVCILPFIILIILILVGVAEKIILSDRLINETYNIGRAVVVSESEDFAEEVAKAMILKSFGEDGSVQISTQGAWEKGTIVTITVTSNVDTLLSMVLGGSDTMSYSQAMMIENGVQQ